MSLWHRYPNTASSNERQTRRVKSDVLHSRLRKPILNATEFMCRMSGTAGSLEGGI